MKVASPKPLKSWIVEASSLDGQRFSWAPQLSFSFQAWRVFWSVFYVCFWLFFSIPLALLLIDGGEPIAIVVVACLWALVTLHACWFLYPLARIRPETILLTESSFTYQPGNLGAILLRLAWIWTDLAKTYRKVQAFEIPRNALNIRLTDEAWCGRGRRLLVEWNGKILELGSTLTDAERAWLFEEIEDWRDFQRRNSQ